MSPEANQKRLAEMPEEEVMEAMRNAAAFASRLIASRTWRGSDEGVLPNGATVKDIVYESFENVVDGSKWDEDKPFWLILKGLVRGKIGNLVRSWENRNFSNSDQVDTRREQKVSFFDELTPHDPSPARLLEQREEDENFMLGLSEALVDRPEELLIVDAIIGGATKRQEIAEITGLSLEEFDQARKRLKRFLDSEWRKSSSDDH